MSANYYGSQAGELADQGRPIDIGFGAAWDQEQPGLTEDEQGRVPGKDDLEGWLAYLESIGGKPCTCRYEWKSLGRLYGSSMGEGWVRVMTEPGCLEHGLMARVREATS